MRDTLYRLYRHVVPDAVRRRIDCRRRRKYWHTCGIIFIHVPKAAGTSISHALYGRSLGHLKAREIARWCPEEFSTLFKFSFVRNPWDRTVSAYRFAVRGATETAGMWKAHRYRIPAFRSFEAFVNEWLVGRDLATADNVFQPQHLFVLTEGQEMPLDVLGRVERLEEGMERVMALTGRRVIVPTLNRVAAPGTYRTLYTDAQLINRVGDIYARDVALFGYDF